MSSYTLDAMNVVIIVGAQKFALNKKILCDVSQFFDNMFNGSFIESKQQEVVINDVNADEFWVFSRWISTVGDVFKSVRGPFLLRMLTFADRFMVEKLRNQCCNHIQEIMDDADNKDFCYDVLETALMQHLADQELMTMFDKWFHKYELQCPEQWNLQSLEKTAARLNDFLPLLSKPSDSFSPQALKHIELLVAQHTALVGQKSRAIYVRTNRIGELAKRIEDLEVPWFEDIEAVEIYEKEVRAIGEQIDRLPNI